MAFLCHTKVKIGSNPSQVSATTIGYILEGQTDKVRNEAVRQQTKLEELNLIIKERRLRWLGHVLRMEDNRIPKQAMYWQADHNTKRKPGRPRKNWIDTIRQDMKSIGMT